MKSREEILNELEFRAESAGIRQIKGRVSWMTEIGAVSALLWVLDETGTDPWTVVRRVMNRTEQHGLALDMVGSSSRTEP